MQLREGRPLLLIDIAVPRDIDPRVAELEGVVLRDIDDLQRVVERNLSGREAEARPRRGADRPRARALHALARHARGAADDRRAARARGRRSCAGAGARTRTRWESLTEADRERLELLAATIAKRLLQQPILRLKARERRARHLRVHPGAAGAVRPRGRAVIRLRRRRRSRAEPRAGGAGAGPRHAAARQGRPQAAHLSASDRSEDPDRHARQRACARTGPSSWRDAITRTQGPMRASRSFRSRPPDDRAAPDSATSRAS